MDGIAHEAELKDFGQVLQTAQIYVFKKSGKVIRTAVITLAPAIPGGHIAYEQSSPSPSKPNIERSSRLKVTNWGQIVKAPAGSC